MKLQGAVARRIPLYLTCLERFKQEGFNIVTSRQIAEVLGLSPQSVRKDFSLIGTCGSLGFGYQIDELIACLKDGTRIRDAIRIAVVGVGPMARYIVNQTLTHSRCLRIVARFGFKPRVAREKETRLDIIALEEIPSIIQERQVRLIVVEDKSMAHLVFLELGKMENPPSMIVIGSGSGLEAPIGVKVQYLDLVGEMERSAIIAGAAEPNPCNRFSSPCNP
ncbi:MAG: hypothetical protein HYY09_07615 [Firmicutes bacterium]|nr:hypothetical protein [Bacillota bacterium]